MSIDGNAILLYSGYSKVNKVSNQTAWKCLPKRADIPGNHIQKTKFRYKNITQPILMHNWLLACKSSSPIPYILTKNNLFGAIPQDPQILCRSGA